MTLPAGTISMSQVKAELGLSGALSMRDSRVMALAGVAAGNPISMSQLRNKSAYTAMSGYYGVDFDYDCTGGTGYNNYNLGCTPYTSGVTGGSGGYTYNWVFVSGSQSSNMTGGTTATPVMNYTIGKFGTAFTAVYRCDITDSTGHVVSVTTTIRVDNTIQ